MINNDNLLVFISTSLSIHVTDTEPLISFFFLLDFPRYSIKQIDIPKHSCHTKQNNVQKKAISWRVYCDDRIYDLLMTRSQVCQQFSIYLKKIMLTPSFLLAEALLLASDKPLKVIEPNANCIYDQDCAEIHRSILLLTKKKRGGQNRTAQWSRKGKSKNLGSKSFLVFATHLYSYLKV